MTENEREFKNDETLQEARHRLLKLDESDDRKSHPPAPNVQSDELENNVKEEIYLKKTRIHSLKNKRDKMEDLLASEDLFLSEGTWKRVESFAGLATKMNMKDLNLTNLLLAICNMKKERIKTEEKRSNNNALMCSFTQQNLKIKKSNEILKSRLDTLEKVITIQESQKGKINENINFFNTKSAEYEHTVESYKNRLKAVDFKTSLQHSELIEYSKVIETLEERLKVSLEKLKSYKKLPPNEKLTESKIKEKKEELVRLENEFSSLLEMWETGIKDVPKL